VYKHRLKFAVFFFNLCRSGLPAYLSQSDSGYGMTKQGSQHHIQHGATRIEYSLIYMRRKTLAIQVTPDGMVTVKAPVGSALDMIQSIVAKRGGWILRQQQKFQTDARPMPQPRRYINGEGYRYLGQTYDLTLETSQLDHVELRAGQLVVYVRDTNDKARIAHLIDKWYRKQAAMILQARMAACFPRVQGWGVAYPELGFRTMKTRWGSCRANGRMTFNIRLIQVEPDLIDYVVLHELCHLKELNHSRAFYALMDEVLPDWRKRRERLNKSVLF
jgi:predicted metal-dependent hydrolase